MPALDPLVGALRRFPLVRRAGAFVDRTRRRIRRTRRRIKRELAFWSKHELAWVIVMLALSRRDARSRVIRGVAVADVELLREHLPGGGGYPD